MFNKNSFVGPLRVVKFFVPKQWVGPLVQVVGTESVRGGGRGVGYSFVLGLKISLA